MGLAWGTTRPTAKQYLHLGLIAQAGSGEWGPPRPCLLATAYWTAPSSGQWAPQRPGGGLFPCVDRQTACPLVLTDRYQLRDTGAGVFTGARMQQLLIEAAERGGFEVLGAAGVHLQPMAPPLSHNSQGKHVWDSALDTFCPGTGSSLLAHSSQLTEDRGEH
jgi:hypothetical protein